MYKDHGQKQYSSFFKISFFTKTELIDYLAISFKHPIPTKNKIMKKIIILLFIMQGIAMIAQEKNIEVFFESNSAVLSETTKENLQKLTSLENFKEVIMASKTILWNGPLGVFEMENFANGTITLGNFIAESTANGAFSLVGGGDSVAAVKQFNLEEKISII